MPFVFLGSFFGVIIGKLIGDKAQTVIYAVTVAWSIYTTVQKVIQLRRQENAIFAPTKAPPKMPIENSQENKIQIN